MAERENHAPPIIAAPLANAAARHRPTGLLWLALLFLAAWIAGRLAIGRSHASFKLPPPFPLKGYLLVNERDELAWYRVAIPENRWTKIAEGSFMLDQEFGLVQNGRECALQKREGQNLRSVDVRTGKTTVTPASAAVGAAPENEWRFGRTRVTFEEGEWWVRGPGAAHIIPGAAKSLGDSAMSQPWSAHGSSHVLFVKTTEPTSTTIHFDLLVVDAVTGKSTLALSVPPSNAHFMPDPMHQAIYFLGTDGGLDRWEWKGESFARTAHWQLPGMSSNESWRSILTVLGDWVLYEATVEPPMPLFAPPPRPRYYAFNTRTRAWALVLDPPQGKRGEAVAWLDRQ